MERVYIKNLKEHEGREVLINGSVSTYRDQGKMVFLDIRDMTGTIQCVALPNSKALEIAKEIRNEWAVEIVGKTNKRPEKNIVKEKINGDIELEVLDIKILNRAKELPFELGSEINLDTHLDNLPLMLKTEKVADIFKIQATILDNYRKSLQQQGFTEFMSPILVGGDAEGGAAAFKVDYYYDQTAYLATSPQFYKQIMVGSFERAFCVSKIFRAEKHATTRHLSEATCIDFEMGFIKDEKEVMRVLEKTIKETAQAVVEKHSDILKKFNAEELLIPEQIPVLTLTEAHKILGVEPAPDMEPEHERNICEWAKKEHKSDFVFITKFPTSKRAFYTYEEPNEAPFSRGFDLLFKGLEINSGAQRIHIYEDLINKMKSRGLDIEKFSFYLQTFKYGIPPHGGCSTGLERFTAKILGLPNVKEATLFPRDINRIDNLLSK